MAIEEEFAIEIPDAEADEITTVQDGKCDDIHIMILSVLTFFFFFSSSYQLCCQRE